MRQLKVLNLFVLMFCLLAVPRQLQATTIVDLNEQFKQLSGKDQQRAKMISDQLRCPTCTGLSVLQSDAPFSLQIREAVIEHVKEGQSEEWILDFFTKRYGLWILREPPSEGFHLVAWLIPILFMVFGALGLWLFVWRKQSNQQVAAVRSREEILKEMDEQIIQYRNSQSVK